VVAVVVGALLLFLGAAPGEAWTVGQENWYPDAIDPAPPGGDSYHSAGWSYRVVRAFAYAESKLPWEYYQNSASALAHGEKVISREECDGPQETGSATQTASVTFRWYLRAYVDGRGLYAHAEASCEHKATLMPAEPGGVPHVESAVPKVEADGPGEAVGLDVNQQLVGLYCQSVFGDGTKAKFYLYAEARAAAKSTWPLAASARAGIVGGNPIETECTDWIVAIPHCQSPPPPPPPPPPPGP
jgi:hypothetical protein